MSQKDKGKQSNNIQKFKQKKKKDWIKISCWKEERRATWLGPSQV